MRRGIDWIGYREKGSITIYLVIVFMSMLMLFGLFIDLARIKIAQNQIRRVANASMRSVLAEYDTAFRSSYGLFGTGERDFGKEFKTYVEANLSYDRQQNFTLLNLKYESTQLELLHPVSDKEVLKQQILETVKYKAPVDMGRDLIEKFMQIRNAAGFFVQSNEIRDSFSKIDNSIEGIHQSNQKIQEAKRQTERIKDEQQTIDEQIRSETSQSRRDQLKEEKAALNRELEKIRGDVKEELYKSNRACLEAEAELKKVQDSKRLEAFSSDKPSKDSSGMEDLEVTKEIEDQTADYGDKVATMKSEIKRSQDLLREESSNSNQFGGLGIETATTAYEERQKVLNDSEYHDPHETELKNLNEKLKTQFPEISKNFNPLTVGDVKSFDKAGGEEANGIAEYLKNLYNRINVQDNLAKSRDEMFINEYILNYFSNLTSEPVGESGYSFRNTEAEYICYGENSKAGAISDVYISRFILDSMGYFAFTKGIPELTLRTVYSLVMGAIQASVDTYQLVGLKEAVPLVVVHPNNPLQDVTLTYKDHLRLFLLLHSGESVKLARISETIKARSGLTPETSFTTSRGTVSVSIPMWFLPMAGISDLKKGPFGTELKNGRCYISKNVEFNY